MVQFTDADSPTFLLAQLTRGRCAGKNSRRRSIALRSNLPMSKVSKSVASLRRPALAPNVINYEKLTSRQPNHLNDFPHNGGRLVVKSEGYDVTMVASKVVVQNGEHSGNRPGKVIR